MLAILSNDEHLKREAKTLALELWRYPVDKGFGFTSVSSWADPYHPPKSSLVYVCNVSMGWRGAETGRSQGLTIPLVYQN